MNRVRANQIVSKALQTRKKFLNVGANVPICPFNLAETMGFDVRFVKIASFEGMYLADEGIILISAERPEGRKAFTCAHELGHHVLRHGTVIDEIIASGSEKNIEQEADFFAGMLLMPSSAIRRAGKLMGIDFNALSSEQAYILSKYMGVSLDGLITHIYFNLGLITQASYKKLKSNSIPSIKINLLSRATSNEVFVVGEWWTEKAIDVVVGDYLLVDNSYHIEGQAIIETVDEAGMRIIQADQPGIAKISSDKGWSAFVRVSRKNFSGMYQYRHEEDVE